MSRYHSYLNTAAKVLLQYNGSEPFAASLKKFFAQQKKYGSKDRKQIAHLCYCFFRLGKALTEMPLDERILMALFLCSTERNEMLATLKPEWNESVHLSIKEKIAALTTHNPLRITQIFPWEGELSAGIDHEAFNKSFLSQPHLFLRARPGYGAAVREKLKEAGFREASGSEPIVQHGEKWMRLLGENCIALPNSSKVEDVIELDKEAVVQDYSSQRIAGLLELVRPGLPQERDKASDEFEVWDCCAASGGKSILARDILGDIDLTVSDIRETMLVNLRKRFERAGIRNYKSFTCDLIAPNSELPTLDFRLILCDVPCTGSGTWSRTPEQLYYFDASSIDKYSNLQRKIVSNVLNHQKPGAHFLYITCSVFRKENEEIVDFIKEKFHLKLVKMEFLKGYDQHADSLFAALFIASEV